ncbi:hypothetical protein [Methylobacterium nodulans]|uniref:Uncharacterized protein n=1 Tax=Methylobacterium nodulans (strain LMG 21967 / CNCM I-2342 / ORS 2060) TaxID=460265 RepID=B8IWK9_METNO|nr:hypothetical protein [Methylobacterium nodulans]ACL62799.1 hypothetical protein Mnod_8743 [Methylobacterium nodulans ORS 2060]
MPPPDPLAVSPGLIGHYVNWALELAAQHRAQPSVDIAASVDTYLAEVRARARALPSKIQGAWFLSAVRTQVRLQIPRDPKVLAAIASDVSEARRLDTLTLIVDRLVERADA